MRVTLKFFANISILKEVGNIPTSASDGDQDGVPADVFRLAICDSGRPRGSKMCFPFFGDISTVDTERNTATSASDGQPDWVPADALRLAGKNSRRRHRSKMLFRDVFRYAKMALKFFA